MLYNGTNKKKNQFKTRDICKTQMPLSKQVENGLNLDLLTRLALGIIFILMLIKVILKGSSVIKLHKFVGYRYHLNLQKYQHVQSHVPLLLRIGHNKNFFSLCTNQSETDTFL